MLLNCSWQYIPNPLYKTCGGQNLSLCAGLKVPFFDNNMSEEKKAQGKAP